MNYIYRFPWSRLSAVVAAGHPLRAFVPILLCAQNAPFDRDLHNDHKFQYMTRPVLHIEGVFGSFSN